MCKPCHAKQVAERRAKNVYNCIHCGKSSKEVEMAYDRAVCLACKRLAIRDRLREMRRPPVPCEACGERPSERGPDRMCIECIDLANTVDRLCSA